MCPVYNNNYIELQTIAEGHKSRLNKQRDTAAYEKMDI